MVHLFIYLILSANHEPKKWRGITVERGQLITSRKKISEETGLSHQIIRTCIERLKSTSEITSKSTSKYTIITICNYGNYQDDEIKSTSKITSKNTRNQPATNQQLTTNNNDKNEKNVKKQEKGLEPPFQGALFPESDLISDFIRKFNEIRKTRFKVTEKVKNQFHARLKEGFTVEQMLDALKAAMKDKHHIDTAFKYLTPEFFTRSDKIERFLNQTGADGVEKENELRNKMLNNLKSKK